MKQHLAVVVACLAAALPAQSPPASPIATETLVVRGRCVDFETDAPLARCRVQLTGHQSTGYPLAWSRTDWADPAEVTTGPDGVFRFEVRLSAADEELDRGRYHVTISHAQYAGWFSHCAFVIACAQVGVDYGDVRLPKGVRPRVRCVDTNGELQAGVQLELRPAERKGADAGLVFATGDGPHWWIEGGAYARTDIDGYLHLDDPLPPGDYTLIVHGREADAKSVTVKLPHAEPIVAVVKPLDAARSILGHLVDESGVPVEGAALSDGDDGPTACVTRRDGTFTLFCTKPTGRTTATLRIARNRRFDGWINVGVVEWGQRDVELVLPASPLHTFVVRTPRGAPVEDFSLHCLPSVRNASLGVRLAGSFPGGRATCRLQAGEYVLLAVPRGDRVLASGWQPVSIDPTRAETEITVTEAVARPVEVVFAGDRTAAAGVLVEAIVGGEPAPYAWVRPNTMIAQPGSRLPAMQVVASARTDAQGRATLQLPEAGPLHLRVSGPGVCAVVQAADLANANAHQVVVERGATLHGSLGPLPALQALDPEHDPAAKPSIYAYCRGRPPTLTVVYGVDRQQREGVRIDPQGRFRCDGLPPGPVELQLRRWEKIANSLIPVEPPLVLGTWTLDVGETKPVDVHLPAAAGSGR